MKKILLFLMLMPMAAMTVHSATFTYQKLNYEIISEAEKTVSVAKANYTGDVVIPEIAINGEDEYSVTSIGNGAFANCTDLKSVTIPNSVTSIGSGAFSYCSRLTSVTIPNSVTSIGNEAFKYCTALTSVTIPNSVTSIGRSTFFLCSKLTSVTIPNSVTSIDQYAFQDCSGLTSVTIPNSVTSISDYVFNGCTSLKDLIFEDGNESLTLGYNYANKGLFFDCPLEKLYLGRTLSYSNAGYSPFCKNTKLKQVIIGNSVTSIGKYAFSECSGLTSVTIGNSVTSIEDHAFYSCSGLTSVTIPNSVITIDEYAFFSCSGLTSVTIGTSVSSIGGRAFMNCSELTSVTIPNSVTTIDEYAFSNCSGLTSVTIGNSVSSIGDYAFKGCSGLTSVTIPNSVTSIGSYTFNSCTSLNDLRFEDGDESLTLGYNLKNSGNLEGKGMFYDCPLNTLYLGRNLSYDNSRNAGYSPFYNIKSLEQVVLGNSVTEIGERFFENTAVFKITIGEAVDLIGDYAFPATLRIVISLNATPPTVNANTFNSKTFTNGELFVPEAALINYQYADYWRDFLKIEAIPNSGSGGSDDQGGESIFNTKIDKYIYIGLDDEQAFTDYLPSDVSASSWESSDDDIVEVTNHGKAEAYEYGNVIVRALDGEGNALLTLGVFVCPTVKIHYGTGKTYEHHVIYNSTPSFYIAAPDDYEIISVEHDGADITEAVLANEGYYTPASPITENSTIKVSLRDTRDPSDLNGDGVVDVSDLNFLIERIMNNN